jgi:hypothetical protein
MLGTILPSLNEFNIELKKCEAYMTIIGGISVEMCARLNSRAPRYLSNIASEDIDLKFVVPNVKHIKAVTAIRMRFLKKALSLLQDYIRARGYSTVSASINTSLLKHKLRKVRDINVASIHLHIGNTTYELLDTGLYYNRVPYYGHFKKIADSKQPIPFTTHNFVNFTTCEYMLYDTCRMLVDSSQYLQESKSMIAMFKFNKYIAKFMALYVVLNKTDLPKKLRELYDGALVILKSINLVKLKGDIKKSKVRYDDIYINRIIADLGLVLHSSKGVF